MHLTLIDDRPLETQDDPRWVDAQAIAAAGHRVRLMVPAATLAGSSHDRVEVVVVPAPSLPLVATLTRRWWDATIADSFAAASHAKTMITRILAMQDREPTDLVELPLQAGWAVHRPTGIAAVARITGMPALLDRPAGSLGARWMQHLEQQGLRQADAAWSHDAATIEALQAIPALRPLQPRLHHVAATVEARLAFYAACLRRHRSLTW